MSYMCSFTKSKLYCISSFDFKILRGILLTIMKWWGERKEQSVKWVKTHPLGHHTALIGSSSFRSPYSTSLVPQDMGNEKHTWDNLRHPETPRASKMSKEVVKRWKIKRSRKDVCTVKRGRTGDLRVVRTNLMWVASNATWVYSKVLALATAEGHV